MAYKKFNGKKFMKRFKKKYRKATRGNKSTSVAYTALRIAKKLQRKIEYKHHDYKINAFEDIIALGSTYPLIEGIGEAVGNNDRIGTEINLARAHINLDIAMNSTTSALQVSRNFRVVLCRGIRENSTVPIMAYSTDAVRGVYDDVDTTVLMARKADNNIRDTKILCDKVFTLTPGQSTVKQIRWNFKLGWKAQFAENSELTENGGLFLMICSDFGPNGDMQVRMNHRITYSE